MRYRDFFLGFLIGRGLSGRNKTSKYKPATACEYYAYLVGIVFYIFIVISILSGFGVIAYSIVNITVYIWLGMIIVPLFFIITSGIIKLFRKRKHKFSNL